MQIESFFRCKCGAITVNTDKGGYSCREENLQKFFPSLDLASLKEEQEAFSCNHCVNHYGLDLCACGSGESPDECQGGHDICGKPMQSIEQGYINVVDTSSAWPLTITEAGSISAKTLHLLDASEAGDVSSVIGNSLAKAINAQKKFKKEMETFIDILVEQIKVSPLPGVKVCSDSPEIILVPYSTITSSKNINLSAEFYSQNSQARLVRAALSSYIAKGDVIGLAETLKKMADTESVLVNKTRYALNPRTLKVLATASDAVASTMTDACGLSDVAPCVDGR